MKIVSSTLSLFLLAAQQAEGQMLCPSSWTCARTTTTAPTLDGDLMEWTEVEGIETSLQMPLTAAEYMAGTASLKCVYDDTNIYFALEFPGLFRFNATDNHQCAAIGKLLSCLIDRSIDRLIDSMVH